MNPDRSKRPIATGYGGYLRDLPEPVVRFWPTDDPKAPRRKVELSINRFSIGRHYHISLKEEHNPVWNPSTLSWEIPWDDEEGRGKTEFFFAWNYDIEHRYSSYYLARVALERLVEEHFPDHAVIWRPGPQHYVYLGKQGD